MTGFGKSVIECCQKKITIEIKSLNSKQLDITTRIPGSYRELELEMRNIIARELERGKVELIVSTEALGTETSVCLNVDALRGYKAQIQQASKELGIAEPEDWYSVLMRLPDVLKSDAHAEISAEEKEGVLKALSEAVSGLMEHRRAEGLKLEEFFTVRVNKISKLLAEVPRYETERVAKIRSRIEEGLDRIKGVDYDKARLEQEMIFYIEKLDINEEKQRLRQHLDYFLETIALQKAGQGKKLGFIAQEMGREINTLGSKSNHADLQKLVVRMKDELEQIKEQVLNVM